MSISRRSFVGAMSSLLVVPLLDIQQTVDRHQLLMMFTDSDSVRYDLSRPYYLSGHAYATCSRTMARINSSETELLDESIKVPPMEKVWGSYYKPATKWEKFELHDIADLECHTNKYAGTCPECDDRWIPVPKEWLDEEGYIRPEHWNERNVEWETNEMRDRSCKLCHGEDWHGPWLQRIGQERISYQFAKRLAKIPGCEIALSEPLVGPRKDQMNTVLFRSDLISGIVCCVTKD